MLLALFTGFALCNLLLSQKGQVPLLGDDELNFTKEILQQQQIFESLDYNCSKISITSCKFINCFSDTIEEGHLGGAIFISYSLSSILDSVFDNCAASEGGALYAYNSEIHTKLTNFTNNLALNAGGVAVFYHCPQFSIEYGFSMYNDAMYHGCFDIHEANGTIKSHNFIANSAKVDTAGISIRESVVTLENCLFEYNNAQYYPTTLQIEEGEKHYPTSCNVDSCRFFSNAQTDDQMAVHILGDVIVSFTNCQFDVQLNKTILEYRSPSVTYINNVVIDQTQDPYQPLVNKSIEVVHYSKIFDHSRSDFIATVFVILIPLYVGVVFIMLIKG